MTMLMQDAAALLSASAKDAKRRHDLFDLLYSDDTLICGSSAKHVQELAIAVEKTGVKYGLSLNWEKTQALITE